MLASARGLATGGKDLDEVKKQRAVRDLAMVIGVGAGLPTTALARPLGYLAGVADDQIEPTGPADAVRGIVTGNPSKESRR